LKIAVIGGSGLYDINNPSEAEELNIVTPWGETSDSILKTEEEGHDIYFLSRHGRGHLIAPSEINFILTPNIFNSFIISLCLGLSITQAVIFSGFLFKYSDKLKIFSLTV